ncbi:hypothetical protein BDW59DRAFT_151861, partial [Aspergillus cavernicola]
MARAAVIPQSPPKRATRGRAKGTTTNKATGKQASRITKATKAAETKRNVRTAAAVDSETEDETDDEIGVIESKSQGKTTGANKSKPVALKSGRGRRVAAVVENGSESEDDDDELAQSDAPKKRAGRPKAKAVKEEATTKTAATSKPRGRPKGTSVKSASEEDVLKENTRKNARGVDLSSSQQGLAEIFITTNSSTLRGPAKKKKVTFQEMSDSESEVEMSEPAPTTRRRKGTVVAKDQEGLGAKPVRKAPTPGTRGRKPAATKKGGAKPLSPKKATQVAKAISSYVSSDGDDDELNGGKDDIKLVVHSSHKQGQGNTGLSSPVRRINFTPGKISKTLDENGEPALAPPKAFDFGDSLFMSSPARRPPPSPFHFTLKETPKRSGLSLRESTNPLARPESTPTQNSPLRASPKKANLGTPGRGSLFLRGGEGVPQPSFTPAQNSPLKLSPKKGIFGAFSSQQPSQQPSTPFKSSLLRSPARKVVTPFKSSRAPVPSSLCKESRLQIDSESDDETVSMYDESPLRGQNLEGATELEAEDGADEGARRDSPINQRNGFSDEEDVAQSDQDSTEEPDQEEFDEEDGMSPLEVDERAEDVHTEQEVENMLDEVEADLTENETEGPFDVFGSGSEDNDLEEFESTTPTDGYEKGTKRVETFEPDLGAEQEHADFHEESDMEEDVVPAPSAYRHSLNNGLEDVFTEKSPSQKFEAEDNAMSDANDEGSFSDDDSVDLDYSKHHEGVTNEPTLVGEMDTNHLTSLGPIQPYEIEEVEDTPFVNFLLTHWAPTLPCVEYEPIDTEDIPPHPNESQDEQNNVPESPVLMSSPEQNTPSDNKEETQEPTPPNRRPRFTLLAEQLSQWKASSPAKDEGRRPRRRGVFSLAGRSSDVPSDTARAPSTDIFANAPSFSSINRSQNEDSPAPALEIHQDKEDLVVDKDEDLDSENSARQPMAEIIPDQKSAPETPTPEAEVAGDEVEEPAETANYPVLELPEDEKENEGLRLPIPVTPSKTPSLNPQTYHTVSKVPLKAGGEISPLKNSRKRGRSLSITSPVRSSPRLRGLILPRPRDRGSGFSPGLVPRTFHRLPESPPRKSPKLQQGSVRKSQARRSISTPVVAPRTHRSKTPSRSSSPSKSSQKQVSTYGDCLRGTVVYVDVHTTEGEDASGIFIELLSQMGARCIKHWSWNPRLSVSPEESAVSEGKVGITHVVFKDGGVRTLEKVRQAAGLVKCIGVGWVLDCERENKWLDEVPYAVDSSIIPRGGAKRRKSMEPRALSNLNGTLIKAEMAGPSSSRKSSMATSNFVRSTTPQSHDDPSTPEGTPRYQPSHTEDQRYWQTPRTPGVAALGYNFDSIDMSPATPFYLSQRSRLVQQTCPPKQTRQGLFSKTGSEEEPSQRLTAKLEAARRKSLAFKPAIGSPLI